MGTSNSTALTQLMSGGLHAYATAMYMYDFSKCYVYTNQALCGLIIASPKHSFKLITNLGSVHLHPVLSLLYADVFYFCCAIA